MPVQISCSGMRVFTVKEFAGILMAISAFRTFNSEHLPHCSKGKSHAKCPLLKINRMIQSVGTAVGYI